METTEPVWNSLTPDERMGVAMIALGLIIERAQYQIEQGKKAGLPMPQSEAGLDRSLRLFETLQLFRENDWPFPGTGIRAHDDSPFDEDPVRPAPSPGGEEGPEDRIRMGAWNGVEHEGFRPVSVIARRRANGTYCVILTAKEKKE